MVIDIKYEETRSMGGYFGGKTENPSMLSQIRPEEKKYHGKTFQLFGINHWRSQKYYQGGCGMFNLTGLPIPLEKNGVRRIF